jgi:hypothetical protein
MSHTLTEVDAHTTPITVPDGSDSRNTAAEVVAALTQALANRTNRLNLHAAFKNAVNMFADANTFEALITALIGIEVNNTDASVAALITRTTASDDANAGNKYKAVLGHNVGGGIGYVNVYAGRDTSEAQYVIALNAVWDTAGQHWLADNTGVPSLALLFVQGSGLRISVRPAGAGTWTTWPSTDGGLSAGGTVHGNILDSATTVTTVDVAASHEITAPTSLDADQTKGFNYSDAGWRTHKINLADFQGGSDLYENLYADGIEGVYKTTIAGRGDMTAWPINLGAGCHIGEIRVRHVHSTTVAGGNDQFLLQKKAGLTGARTTIVTVTAGTGGGVAQTTAVHTGGDETVIENTEYWLRWKVRNTDGTFTTHRVQAIEVDVWDPGPRTKVN